MLEFNTTKRGIDISSGGLRWVEVKREGGRILLTDTAFEPLPEGCLTPSFSRDNVVDREALKKHIHKLVPAGKIGGDIALSLPDSVARVTLVEFDEVPAKRDELEKLILWRMKKTLPIPAEDAKVDYYILAGRDGKIDVLAAIASRKVLREYEDVLREMGFRPRCVDIASLNTLNIFKDKVAENALFVEVSGGESVGIALIVKGELVFFRSKDMEGSIKRVEREVSSTLTYYVTRSPGQSIDDLYLLCGSDCAGEVIEGLKRNFEGNIHRLDLAEIIGGDLSAHEKDDFSPAIGAALRLL